MSIRVKLLLSYILMIITPIALFVLFLHLLFNLFVDNIDEVKEYYNIEETFLEELVQNDIIVLTELQNAALHNPEKLMEHNFLEQYETRLSNRKAGLILRNNDKIVYQSKLINERMIDKLPAHALGTGEHYANKQGYIETDDQSWIFTYSDFHFENLNKGSLFIVLDINPISSFIKVVLPILIAAFLLTFIITNGLLTYLLSRNIIVPILKIKESVNRIKEGDLDRPFNLERKDEFGQLSDSFEEMRKRLKNSVEMQLKYEENRKELINNISHDLKTPITAIKGYVEGIIDGVANDPEKLEKYIHTIYNKATQMDRMINELFLFSKLDLNSLPFHYDKVNLNDYIHDILVALSVDLERNNIQLHIHNHVDKKTSITVDCDKLQRVIMNIMYNSFKFMDKEEKVINFTLTKRHNQVLIEIEDNGSGIKVDDIPHVFDRFYRAEHSRNTDTGGSGIGLAIAKQIIEAHGGTIAVQSDYGKGTTIKLTLSVNDD